MKEFIEFVQESENDENDVVDMLLDLDEQTSTHIETELINLLVSLVKMGKIDETAHDAIFDAIDELVDYETQDLGLDYDDDDYNNDEDEPVDEAQRALYKRRGYVTCPDGRIRKRGKCGKPVDRKKSRMMIRARKKNKRAFAKGVRKAKKTKRKLGMIR